MNYITTTDLRTQSSELVESLKKGKKVSLVHRSQVIGEIAPVREAAKPFDVKKFRLFIKDKPQEGPSYQERDRLYRRHLEERYGKDFS